MNLIRDTFADKAFNFYKNIKLNADLPFGVSALNPYQDKIKLKYVGRFLKKYYSDKGKRIFVLGINPGRFGGGATGINFTDYFALGKYCGIENDFDKKRELSSVFIYKFIEKWGGPEKFYKNFYLTAISPLGFIRNGLNYNYYDHPGFYKKVSGFIEKSLRDQIDFGANQNVAIVLGKGKNQKFFAGLNRENRFFNKFVALEHPRFILQYKRSRLDEYLGYYRRVFNEALKV